MYLDCNFPKGPTINRSIELRKDSRILRALQSSSMALIRVSKVCSQKKESVIISNYCRIRGSIRLWSQSQGQFTNSNWFLKKLLYCVGGQVKHIVSYEPEVQCSVHFAPTKGSRSKSQLFKMRFGG